MAARNVGRAAQHDAVRTHEVFHGRAFLQELGVRHHRELQVFQTARASSSRITALTRSPVPTGTVDLSTTTLKPVMCRPILRAAASTYLQVGRAVFVRRRAHGDELHVGMFDAGGNIGRERQAAGRAVAVDQLLQARFVDRHAAGIQQRDLLFVDIEAEHGVAEFGQTGAGHQTDIAATDNRDFHCGSSRIVILDRPGHCV
jgi:hypothetical protein